MSLLRWVLTRVRALFAIFCVGVFTVICSILLLLTRTLGWDRICFVVLPWLWGWTLLLSAGGRLRVFGRENLPQKGSLFLFHHCSHYDIPVLVAALKLPIRFGAKEELFRIPFLSLGMRSVNALKIERSKRDKVLAMYRTVYESLQKGTNFILAPEGTRQIDNVIGRFKNGPFIFAIESKALLVPIVIKNAHHLLKKKSLLPGADHWQTVVTVKILPTIDAGKYNLENLESLQNLVREKMIEGLATISS
ncbi:MAG: lysophospholipid acyltransferase family protein [Pseudomonadota bacterium]|nr:lysophospholipid acyltransferase family protein [Pseudomonadota bacterium]